MISISIVQISQFQIPFAFKHYHLPKFYGFACFKSQVTNRYLSNSARIQK